MDKTVDSKPSEGRISFPGPGTLNEAQQKVFDQVISGPRGTVVGPLRAALHNPELADRWQRLGQVLRFETSLPKRLNELAILVTARRWNCDLEWAIHEQDAIKAGLDPSVSDAIRANSVPDFSEDEEGKEVYGFVWQLLAKGDVDGSVYAAVVDRWGETGVVELTAVVGYYSMVAMTLNVHRIPMPEGLCADLPGDRATLAEPPKQD